MTFCSPVKLPTCPVTKQRLGALVLQPWHVACNESKRAFSSSSSSWHPRHVVYAILHWLTNKLSPTKSASSRAGCEVTCIDIIKLIYVPAQLALSNWQRRHMTKLHDDDGNGLQQAQTRAGAGAGARGNGSSSLMRVAAIKMSLASCS